MHYEKLNINNVYKILYASEDTYMYGFHNYLSSRSKSRLRGLRIPVVFLKEKKNNIKLNLATRIT